MHQQNVLLYQARMERRREQLFWVRVFALSIFAAVVYAVDTLGVFG